MTRDGCSHHYSHSIKLLAAVNADWRHPLAFSKHKAAPAKEKGWMAKWLIRPSFGLNYGNLQKTGRADLLLRIGNRLNMWRLWPDLLLWFTCFKVGHPLCAVVIFPASIFQDYLCGSEFKQKWRTSTLKCWLMALFVLLRLDFQSH